MANNTIQIKRSAVTAAPASLNPGELAYSNAVGGTGVLYIGSTDGATVVPIGGVRTPGTLTANQALVANSTSGINKVYAANVQTNFIEANGAGNTGTAGYILYSGGPTANMYWASAGSLGINTAATYTWTNTHIFQGNTTAASFLTVGANLTMNSVSITWIGNTTTAPTSSWSNTGVITIGNSSITGAPQVVLANTLGTTTINTTSMSTGNSTVYGLGNSLVDVIVAPTGNITINATSIVINAASGTTPSVYVGNSSAYVSINTTSVNAASILATTTVNTGTLYATGLVNAANFTTTGTVNTATVFATGQVNAASHTVGAAFVANTTNILFTGANIYATSANLSILNITVSGNLTVSGTVSAINSQQLIVNDNIIELADGNLTTDITDTGIYSPAGNSTATWYSGIARVAALSTNNAPVFWIFGSNTNPNTSATIDTSSNSVTGYLKSYLVPYGTGGAFVANATAITVTANSTVAANFTINTVSLSTALAVGSGGTGLNTLAAGSLLYGNGTGAMTSLAVAANGSVLQITNNLPAYGALDGGTF